MKSSKSRLALGLALACAAITVGPARHAQAQTFTDLASFNGTNAAWPTASFVQGTDGNLYSTSARGGKAGNGNVFDVTPAGKVTSLYTFCPVTGCPDGWGPDTGVILGSDGNFYGTTPSGGAAEWGTIFRMTPGGKLTTLYSFCTNTPCSDGQIPNGLVQGSNGNLYGTTVGGGANNYGVIFELTPAGKYKALYSFCVQTDCADGSFAYFAPIQASNGNFYGTTNLGGSHGFGVVYEITPAGSYKVLHSFCSQILCADGESPFAPLVQDTLGNFYGTTTYGGSAGNGTVFEMTPSNQFIVLHSFNSSDGTYPDAGLVLANDGNLYGTTTAGGGGGGSLFQITPIGVFSVLHEFCCENTYPNGLFQSTNGLLYGTIQHGGGIGAGEAFSLSNGLNPLVETVPVAAKVGKRVIILGNSLTGSTSVTFNGTAATFSVISDTEITATVPTGATTGTVAVTTPPGTLNSNPVFQVLK